MTDPKAEQAAAFAEEGRSLYQSKQYSRAGESFARAAAGYQEQGEVCLAAEMRNNQAVSLLLARKPRLALDVLTGTSEIFLEAGDVVKAGMALANQAAAWKDLREREKAIDHYARAARIFQDAGEDEMYLQTIQSISSLKLKNRDLIGALFSMQDGLTNLEKLTWRQKLLKTLLKIPSDLLNH